MKTKYYFLAVLAGMMIASCSSDDFISEAPPANTEADAMSPIVFSSLKNNFTRAAVGGASAADSLDRKFVVFGYKGGSTETPGSTVFDNYLVQYTENTANTTESNSSNWEYVGKGPIKHAVDNGITQQTIKYWDYSKDQYDFIAWSTGKKTAIFEGTPNPGEVLVSEITPTTVKSKAYTFEGTAKDLRDCYIADLVTVNKSGAAGTGEVTGYGGTVTLNFRQLGTKVRIGLYETIPGYSVKNVQFYSAANVNLVKSGDGIPGSDPAATYDAAGAKKVNETAKIFTTEANEIYTEGKYTVFFPTVDEPSNVDNNQAHITFAPAQSGGIDVDQATTVEWGKLNYTIRESGESSKDPIYLGRSSNTASFAGNADVNYYVVYLPNQTGTNLNLRVNYTLESIDGSSEEILVQGATAQVPLIYTQWKPGYAYTYLFKISDKTNGYTGAYTPTDPDNITVNSDPAGLYPITFDAVVINAEEDKTQETITTVSAPSITTYQKGSNVVNNNEYLAATGPIFVTVNDGNTEKTPDLANGKLMELAAKATPEVDGMANLYKLPAGNYTEADVVAALQTRDDHAATGTIKGRSGLVLTEAGFTLVNSIEYGVDGNTIDLSSYKYTVSAVEHTANAMKFTATAGTYAFVYTKKAKTTDTPKYQAKTFADGADVNGYYRYALTAAPSAVANTHTGDVEAGVTYFNNNDASAGAITAFVGQGVSNLYTFSDAKYTIASGYAQTGTTYYYTTDGGQHYTAAVAIAYASFASTTLYYWDPTANENAGGYVTKTETEPVDGRAYYQNNDGTGYCVIYPQRTTGLYIIDKTEANIVACGSSDVAVQGMTYFDMYTKNNGVYYTKIIKVE